MKFEWELIEREYTVSTYRAKVKGGWIVRVRIDNESVSMVFVPDPYHAWVIEK